MANLGSLWVQIGGDVKPLKQAVNDAESTLGGFTDRGRAKLNEFAGGWTPVTMAAKAGAVAIGAAAAAMAVLTVKQFDNIDAQAKMADSIGANIKNLAAIQSEAGRAGVNIEAINVAMTKGAMRTSEAAAGVGEVAAVYRELGLNAAELNRLSPDEQFLRIGNALNGLENANDRTRLAMKLFEEQGAKLTNFFRDGAPNIEATIKRMEAFGLAVSRVDAAKIEQANDAVNIAGEAFRGMATTIAVQLAPLITEVANRISAMAQESNGFKTQIIDAFEFGAKAAGFFGDVIRQIHVLVRSFELGLKVLGAATITVFEGATEIISTSINGYLMMFNLAVEKINGSLGTAIPKIELLMNPLSKHAAAARKNVVDTALAIDQLAGSTPPSENIAAFFEAVRARAQASAEATVANKEHLQEITTLIDTKAAEQQARYVEQLGTYLESLQEALYTETEAVMAMYTERQRILDASLNQNLISEVTHANLSIKIAQDRENKLRAIQEASQKAQQKTREWYQTEEIQGTQSTLGSLSSLMNTQSREMFNIGKAAAIAQVTMQSTIAAWQAFTAYGPFFGPIAAAAIAIKGINDINNIRAQRFGGAGTRSSGSFAGGAVPTQTVTAVPAPTPISTPAAVAPERSSDPEQTTVASQPARVINITVEGQGASKEQIRELITQINDEIGDGMTLRVA